MKIGSQTRVLLLISAVVGLLGVNDLFLYGYFTEPTLIRQALSNKVALAFLIEALALLALFLVYVYQQTRSWGQVFKYYLLSMAGSLLFSLPLFLYLQSKPAATHRPE